MNEALVSHRGPGHLWLAGLQARGMQLGLERIRALLQRLGDPQAGLTVIAVAGSDGKGSTSAMIAAMLQAAGLRVGHYTSPHLVETRERVCIDGAAVAAEALDTALATVQAAAEQQPALDPTPFEALTAAALAIYAGAPIDVAVLEIGLGGRLDAVNACEPVVSVVTHLSHDHTAILGDTLAQIAFEKCGIARDGRALVCAQAGLVKSALRKHKLVPRVMALGHEVRVERLQWRGKAGTLAHLAGPLLGDELAVELALAGAHQAENAALAAMAYLAFAEWMAGARGRSLPPIDEALAALSDVAWPMRGEVLQSDPLVVADAAHNPAGMAALAQLLGDIGKGWQIVLAVRRDRDPLELVRPLAAVAAGFFLPRCDNPSLWPADELAVAVDRAAPASSVGVSTAQRCFAQAARELGKGAGVAITGSQHALGEWLQAGSLHSPRLNARLGR